MIEIESSTEAVVEMIQRYFSRFGQLKIISALIDGHMPGAEAEAHAASGAARAKEIQAMNSEMAAG